MKKNDYLLLSSVAAYSFLFFHQNAGLNFLLFTITLILILIINNLELIRSAKWCWAAGLALFSGACIVIHSSALSIIANIFSLMLLSAFSFNAATSSILSFLFAFYSVASSGVFMIIDAVNRNKNSAEESSPKNYKWLGFMSAFVVSIIFFALYKNSNPIFNDYTKWINLDFISIEWFFFTMGGFFLMYAFLYHRTIKPIESWENNLQLTLIKSERSSSKKLETERISLITLFTLLNLMLLVINIGDINTILLDGALPKGVKHSDFVHSGVGTLIFSIVLAISIIMYFLRGDLNFFKGNKFFKSLILFWIIQNILMLISTSIRNQMYISEYTLTYKRIGVSVWLGLAMIGLILTAVKLYFNKTNWYLIKMNVAVWFTALSVFSIVDWDLMITRYNLDHKKTNDIDFYYLFSLSDTNLPEMIAYCKEKAAIETHPLERHEYGNERGTRSYYYGTQFSYLNLLKNKIEHYLINHKNDWRSWDMRDDRILKSLNIK